MNSWRVLMIAVAVAVTVTTTSVDAQTTPNCGQKLISCLDYINTTTTPPNSCCNPIKETVATQLDCLCNLYNTPGFLESLGINVTQALGLSRRCGVTSDLSNCKGSAPSPSSTETPPATPGGGNGAGRVAFTGFSFLLLFWASVLFN